MPITRSATNLFGYLVTNQTHQTFLHDNGPGRICAVSEWYHATLFESFDRAENARQQRVKAGDAFYKEVIRVRIQASLDVLDLDDPREEDAVYTRNAWLENIVSGNTDLGYWDWVRRCNQED